MTDAQLNEILAGIARIDKNQKALMKEVKILRKVIASGEDREYPWDHLKKPRREQVLKVVEYLRAHTNRELHTIRRAAFAAFEKKYRGYPNPVALATYCYKAKVDNWLD